MRPSFLGRSNGSARTGLWRWQQPGTHLPVRFFPPPPPPLFLLLLFLSPPLLDDLTMKSLLSLPGFLS